MIDPIAVPREIDEKVLDFDVMVMTFEPLKILIKWEFLEGIDPSKWSLQIMRGDENSELSPVKNKLIPGTSYPEYLDYETYQRGANHNIFYQILAENKEEGRVIKTPVKTWHGNINLEAIYVIEEHEFLFQDATGMPTFILIRRRSGVRCEECWDFIAQKRKMSNCPACDGSGFISGYYKPIPTWVDYSPDPRIKVIDQWGERQPNEVDVLMTSWPRVHPDDLIIQAVSGKRYKVKRVQEAEMRGVAMLQTARVELVPTTDPEYQIKLSEDEIRALNKQLNEIKNLRSF